MGLVVVLDAVRPITVVWVAELAVTIVTGDVPTARFMYRVNVFAICYPKAIAIAIAVPAGSTCKLVCAVATVVAPVPPLAKANVPASVTAPLLAVFGVNPVVPALKVVTPPEDAAQEAVVPLEVNT